VISSRDPAPDSDPQARAFAPAAKRATLPPHLQCPRLWWAVGWALLAFILYSTLAPSQDVPNLHLWDKLEHAGAFFGLTMWFGGLIRRSRYAMLAFWMLLLGGAIELAQGYMGWGRDMDIHDFYADGLGIAVAFILLGAGLSQWAVLAERLLGLSREPS
jgi:VanZ family protein